MADVRGTIHTAKEAARQAAHAGETLRAGDKVVTLGPVLGNGSFGVVYSCDNDDGVAVKLETQKSRRSQVEYETSICRRLDGVEGFPIVF